MIRGGTRLFSPWCFLGGLLKNWRISGHWVTDHDSLLVKTW
jgi:hypothetical protein